MKLSFELLQEKDILQLRGVVEGWMDFNPRQVEMFLSEKQNIAHVAKLDDTVIGLV